jgi:hypothetical protein
VSHPNAALVGEGLVDREIDAGDMCHGLAIALLGQEPNLRANHSNKQQLHYISRSQNQSWRVHWLDTGDE